MLSYMPMNLHSKMRPIPKGSITFQQMQAQEKKTRDGGGSLKGNTQKPGVK